MSKRDKAHLCEEEQVLWLNTCRWHITFEIWAEVRYKEDQFNSKYEYKQARKFGDAIAISETINRSLTAVHWLTDRSNL